MKKETNKIIVFDFFTKNGFAYTVKDVQDILETKFGMNRNTIRREIYRLKKEGYLTGMNGLFVWNGKMLKGGNPNTIKARVEKKQRKEIEENQKKLLEEIKRKQKRGFLSRIIDFFNGN